MTEREQTPSSTDSTPPTPAQTNSEGRPTKVGVYDSNTSSEGSQNQRLVGMYDRPERTGPSPVLLVVAALVILALIIGLIYFIL